MSELQRSTLTFFIGLAIGLFIAVIIFTAAIDARDEYKAAAIERGFAEYSSKTGVWQWKEPKP